ncbi:MAG: RNA methyltransferase, partial [Cytophagales bacterium]|nr:RNA methyltransferase [Cytophagales bacterium]
MISKKELKFIRSLKIKKYRTAEKCFLVEGEKNVLELLSSDYKVKRLLVTKNFLATYEKSIDFLPYDVVSDKDLADVSSFVTNDQVLAVVEMRVLSVKDINLSNQVFVLDGIRDPGNLGTIIRTLDWFGYDQLICSEDTAELYNPKVISASMGSFTRVKVAYCNLEKLLSYYDGIKLGADM